MAVRIAGGQADFYGKDASKPLIMRYQDSRHGIVPEGLGMQRARRNYLIGRYQHSAAVFDKVKLTELYPGIDLIFYEESGNLEYDFLLARGSDPATIRLDFDNRAQCSIGSEGDLVVSNGYAAIRHRKPRMYQTAGAAIIPVEGSYRLTKGCQVTIAVGSYDRAKAMVVDPVVVWANGLSGTPALPTGGPPGTNLATFDELTAFTVDAEGNTYLAGTVMTGDFPVTPGAVQNTRRGKTDIFLAKLDPSGALIFSTLLGGSGEESVSAITVDTQGNIYLAGKTTSTDFPGGGSSPSFVAKLNPAASALTYVFRLISDVVCLAADPRGNVYFAGRAIDEVLPVTPTAFQRTRKGAVEGYVGKLNAAGAVEYLTYLGGSSNDIVRAIGADEAGNAYVAGSTYSLDFPITASAFQAKYAGTSLFTDGFIAKLNPSGSALVYCSYLGGSADDEPQAVAVDSVGNAYVTGWTASHDFPIQPGGFQAGHAGGTSDAFAVKVDPTGGRLLYASYLGGAGDDQAMTLALDSESRMAVGGWTTSPNFPELDPIQPGRGDYRQPDGSLRSFCPPLNGTLGPGGTTTLYPCRDGFVALVDTKTGSLMFSSYLGGQDHDAVRGVAFDAKGNLYAAGSSQFTAPAIPLAESPESDAWHPPSTFVVKVDPRSTASLVRMDWLVESATYRRQENLPGGLLATIFGLGITNHLRIESADSFPLPTTLDGVSVELNGKPVPLLAVANGNGIEQINFLFPRELSPRDSSRPVSVAVRTPRGGSLPLWFHASTGGWPYVFQNSEGLALIVRASDGSLISAANPARRGELLLLYGTGMGAVDPPVASGEAAPSSPPSSTVAAARIEVGGIAADVSFSGLAPGYAGLYQVNFSIPAAAPSGIVPLVITQGFATETYNTAVE
ncbi:MAG: SBBP repeat-containing protein [Bryobacterales bacterium]|nr:SBBP repeat-containing protein [Bryobacterales bacterium]